MKKNPQKNPNQNQKGFDPLDCLAKKIKLFQQSFLQHLTEGKAYENNFIICHSQLDGESCSSALLFLPCSFHDFQVSETIQTPLGPPQKKISLSVIKEALLKPLRTPPPTFLLLAPCLLELSKPALCCTPKFLWLEELSSISLGAAHAAPLLLEDSS